MEIVLQLLVLSLGFFMLIKGADWFVGGASGIAEKFGIPSLVIGLTIVAMGTSAPEAAVSITAGIKGSNEIAISNLVGSNIFNILCVAGASALITPFLVDKEVLKRDFPISLALMVLLAVMAFTGKVVSRLEGAILFVIFLSYIAYLIRNAIKNREKSNNNEKPMSAAKSIIFIFVGIAAIIGGGQFVVWSAKTLAAFFKMTETFIGVTVVAIGTSLPELVTSIVAAKKGQSDIAIGNVVGSNIFNITFVLGMSSAIHPIAIVDETVIDAVAMVAVNAVGFIFCLTAKKLNRGEGLTMICMYAVYTAYLLIR